MQPQFKVWPMNRNYVCNLTSLNFHGNQLRRPISSFTTHNSTYNHHQLNNSKPGDAYWTTPFIVGCNRLIRTWMCGLTIRSIQCRSLPMTFMLVIISIKTKQHNTTPIPFSIIKIKYIHCIQRIRITLTPISCNPIQFVVEQTKIQEFLGKWNPPFIPNHRKYRKYLLLLGASLMFR